VTWTFPVRHPRSLTGVVCAAGLALGVAGGAAASTYSVNPTLVVLNAATRSALVTLKNETEQPLRFQLSLLAWSQDPAGAMQLAPTEDVVFFPSLLVLQKGEERRVRIGTTAAIGRVERSYRLFIEELPADARPSEPGTVRVLTKTSVPIFVQPTTPRADVAIEGLALAAGRFSFLVKNKGTAHLLPMSVKVAASGESGQAVFEREASVWYVLAGGTRALDLEMPKPDCGQVRELNVTVIIDGKTTAQRLLTPGGACGSI